MDKQDGFFDKLSQYITNLKKFLDDKFWDSSFLLKRRRREIRHTLQQVEGAKEDVQEQIKNIGREDIVAKQATLKEIPDGTMAVYILLNIMKGRDITAWEHALSALPSCSFGRPIYMEEQQVRRAISQQGDSLNSGYVAIYVNHEDILKDEGDCDALGQEIVGLKPEAISSEHIIKFVHYNQEVFLFVDKKLVIDTSADKSGGSKEEAPLSGVDVSADGDGQGGTKASVVNGDEGANEEAQAVVASKETVSSETKDDENKSAQVDEGRSQDGPEVKAADVSKESGAPGMKSYDANVDKGEAGPGAGENSEKDKNESVVESKVASENPGSEKKQSKTEE